MALFPTGMVYIISSRRLKGAAGHRPRILITSDDLASITQKPRHKFPSVRTQQERLPDIGLHCESERDRHYLAQKLRCT